MVKRVVLVSLGVLLAGLFVFGRDAASYVRTSAGYVRDGLRGSVPVEFQIQRARQMIKDLVPEVQNAMHLIAKEEVELKRLDEQIVQSQERLAREKGQLVILRTALDRGGAQTFGGRRYTAEQIKEDLSNRFQRYKTGDATLASLRQMSDARGRTLEAARQKLEGMLAMRRQLQVEVENLEARTQMIAAAETTSQFRFDDSRLGRVKELIADLQSQLDVKEKLVGAEGSFHAEIPVDKEAGTDVAAEMDKYFHGSASQLAAKEKR